MLPPPPPPPLPADPHEVHDAYNKTGVALRVPGQLGTFLTVDSVVRQSVVTSATQDQYLLIQWTPNANRVIWVNTGSNAMNVTNWTASQLTTANPVAIRPMRMSIRIRNITQEQNVMGQVRILCTPTPVAVGFGSATTLDTVTAAFSTNLAAMVSGHPRTHTMTSADLRTTKVMVVPPATLDTFGRYFPFTPSSLYPLGFQTDTALAVENAVMNSTIVHFPSSTIAQTYDIAVHMQDAARFAANSAFAGFERPAPSGLIGFQATVQHLQSKGSVPRDDPMGSGEDPNKRQRLDHGGSG